MHGYRAPFLNTIQLWENCHSIPMIVLGCPSASRYQE